MRPERIFMANLSQNQMATLTLIIEAQKMWHDAQMQTELQVG